MGSPLPPGIFIGKEGKRKGNKIKEELQSQSGDLEVKESIQR